MKLIEYPTRDALMAQVADSIARHLAGALARRDRVSLAVPGGTTPGPVFDALSTVDLDWSRVHILLTDERWVPEYDPQSNAALIRARLLQNNAAAADFTPYYAEGSTIEAAATQLSKQLAPLLPLDVLLLGMGADMHTASLFPGAEGLDAALAADAPLLMSLTVPDHENRRFSLTAPALQGAGATHLLITGPDKRAALDRAQTLTAQDAPVQTVLPTATVHWSAQ